MQLDLLSSVTIDYSSRLTDVIGLTWNNHLGTVNNTTSYSENEVLLHVLFLPKLFGDLLGITLCLFSVLIADRVDFYDLFRF